MPGHRRDKPVAAPRHCLNAATVRAVLIEDTPQRGDLDRQVIVFDDDSRPCGRHDLVPRNEVAGTVEEYAQDVERARAKFHRSERGVSISPEQAAPVELEPIELENVGRGERRHRPRLPGLLSWAGF